MKPIKTYNNLNESSAPDGYITGYVKRNVNIANINPNRSVFVDALQYTRGGDSDKIRIILKNGIKSTIVKSDLDIKF
jgi:hypothetical protein